MAALARATGARGATPATAGSARSSGAPATAGSGRASGARVPGRSARAAPARAAATEASAARPACGPVRPCNTAVVSTVAAAWRTTGRTSPASALAARAPSRRRLAAAPFSIRPGGAGAARSRITAAGHQSEQRQRAGERAEVPRLH
jgi:hypothetical protein